MENIKIIIKYICIYIFDMPINSNLIQQSPHLEQDFSSLITNPQLRKISTLQHLDAITSENEVLVNNSYILLTDPGVTNFTIKLQTLLDKLNTDINTQIINQSNDFNQELLNVLSNYYNKSQINTLLDNKYQTLQNYINNLESSFELYQNRINSSIYTKDQINDKISQLQTILTNYVDNNLDNRINEIIDLFNDLNDDLTQYKQLISDTYYTKSQINDLISNLQTEIQNNNSVSSEEILNLLSNYYTKDEIDTSIDNKHQPLYDLITELTSELNTYKSLIAASYYDKDKINQLLGQLQNAINQLQNNIEQVQTNVNITNNKIDNIENELLNNTNTEYENSRIDKLEKELQYIRNNVYIDNIDKIIWQNYGITDNNSTYIIDNQSVTFTINKGTVIAKYNDDTSDENVTNVASYILSTGQLSNNIVTLSTSASEGNQTIKVQYKDHIGENLDGTIAQINFKITKTKYNNYLWIVDSANLTNIVNNGVFNTNAYSTYYSSSLSCPMQSGVYYNVEQIIKEKFYNNSGDISNNALYIILPSQYINLQNLPLIKINGKVLKTNIFELNILGEESRFTIREQANNVNGYYKNIEYSVIKITNSINSGIVLNI